MTATPANSSPANIEKAMSSLIRGCLPWCYIPDLRFGTISSARLNGFAAGAYGAPLAGADHRYGSLFLRGVPASTIKPLW
jgi:hypothetical protein